MLYLETLRQLVLLRSWVVIAALPVVGWGRGLLAVRDVWKRNVVVKLGVHRRVAARAVFRLAGPPRGSGRQALLLQKQPKYYVSVYRNLKDVVTLLVLEAMEKRVRC